MLGRCERERIILEKRSARSRFHPRAVQCTRRKSIREVVSCLASLEAAGAEKRTTSPRAGREQVSLGRREQYHHLLRLPGKKVLKLENIRIMLMETLKIQKGII
ncbi:hypothetical protein AVEN_73959-1 [Araneus ventricosus]|uniref:Uncharacterized protein n=1 Tax=Araneus ventricosus TaxID=182803 RepID=A0A4Y2VS47_ARAVE|nr:hypothetical protein AVEN_73959-1 [Araneus ventricosus]